MQVAEISPFEIFVIADVGVAVQLKPQLASAYHSA
jgi:hypothetical protein